MEKKTSEPREGSSRSAAGEKPRAGREEDQVEILEIVGQEEETAPASPGEPGAPEEPEKEAGDLRAEMENLRREKAEIQERLLRKHADLENMRKRLEREKEEFFQYATASLMEKILPVLDNLERALAVPEDTGGDGLREGLRLIHQQFREILEREGLRSVEALGKKFDPTQHEAVLREETVESEPEEILEELQKGFFFRGRLLRPALVRVAVPPSRSSPEKEPPEEPGGKKEEEGEEG